MARERSFAGVYDAMRRRYAKQLGDKPRRGRKTPNKLYLASRILDCFPDARFICITPRGRDACAISLDSDFGAGHIHMAAHGWNAANAIVMPNGQNFSLNV